jgi:hypothetical protein
VDQHIASFAKAGADVLTVHLEAGPHVHRSLQAVRAAGCKAGLAINPGTGIEAVAHLLDDIDLLCVMTVNPGYGGQKLIPAMVAKVQALKAMTAGRDIRLQVDGGVALDTARSLAQAGADLLVAGSAVFQGGPEPTAQPRRAARPLGHLPRAARSRPRSPHDLLGGALHRRKPASSARAAQRLELARQQRGRHEVPCRASALPIKAGLAHEVQASRGPAPRPAAGRGSAAAAPSSGHPPAARPRRAPRRRGLARASDLVLERRAPVPSCAVRRG